MIRWNLRSKILLAIGMVIFVVLGTSTYVHLQVMKQDFLESIKERSEALAQDIINGILEVTRFQQSIEGNLGALSLRCIKLYERNKEKNIAHFAVINASGIIEAHNDRTFWEQPVKDPYLLAYLQQHEQMIVLIDEIYHTLVPVFGDKQNYLATIDIGVPKDFFDQKVQALLVQTIVLFLLFLLFAFVSGSLMLSFLILRPIKNLVESGQQLAEGNLVQNIHPTKRRDEIAILGKVFNQVAGYLQHLAEVASQIAIGKLNGEVHVRSQHDLLGKAVQEMLRYLIDVADVAANVANGDLTETIQVRSSDDAFGRAIQIMTEGLRTLILKIRASAEQIAMTGVSISSLADQDITIVKQVSTAADTMTSTMQELGGSIEEVATNIDTLSASVEVTSTSVSEMTVSIAHIASKTNDLTAQAHQTITSLGETVRWLKDVEQSTDASKQLAQETIQDAIQGQDAVEQVMGSMETLNLAVSASVDAITRFAKRSEDIDTILSVIREITERTSLLALNASIIAAQAGAHGRGFAVVAEEIKNLSSGVESSTKDIAQIVKSLQQDTGNVVQTIHAGADEVKQGIERTSQARETLQKILNSAERSSALVVQIASTLHDLVAISHQVSASMEQVNMMTNEITAATNQQKATTEQIHQAIVQINDMTSHIQRAITEQATGVRQLLDMTGGVIGFIQQNLESSQHIVHTTQELSSQAELLLHAVDRFKLKTS
ncbi:methyl-accepting chemotaxis sensory transducer [Candidatus Vecturithrix granuli]|uniref:Methyl-accepting chemotaxis sensory transducer n=1 Tax=Vecturithrix granuli TaxID=1499967 RepID=A0A081C5F6_VECG1|nr:methyl-accepting chemotaxis sensory transducer [Candidatus Vecturithrix granuli]